MRNYDHYLSLLQLPFSVKKAVLAYEKSQRTATPPDPSLPKSHEFHSVTGA
jgi:hypothetical protein